MTGENPRKRRSGPIAAVLLTAVVAGAIGAIFGALALALGVYFASYTDRLVPFYYAGAIAGFATAATYALLRLWSKGEPFKERARIVFAALLGACVIFAMMTNQATGMSFNQRTKTSLAWLATATLFLVLIGRRHRTVVPGNAR